MSRTTHRLPLLLLLALAPLALADVPPEPKPAQADTFEREAAALLKRSMDEKKGIYVHVGGQRIGGAVKAIGPDSVVLANQEHSRIVIRRERIDAIESN